MFKFKQASQILPTKAAYRYAERENQMNHVRPRIHQYLWRKVLICDMGLDISGRRYHMLVSGGASTACTTCTVLVPYDSWHCTSVVKLT